MKVDFFVHGVPNGEDFWGKDEERSYCGNFYDNSTDRLKFVIQAKNTNGATYYYYNYLVYESIVANGGRNGAYFGMTLRFDAFCVEFMNIFRILDTAYHSYIVGKLLISKKSKLEYSVPSFSNFDVNGVFDKILVLLQETLTNDSFARVAVQSTNGQYRKWNLYDCTNESLLNEITQYGKIVLSPYYPSINESSAQQQYESKIKAIQQQCQTQINESVSAYAQKEQTANATIKSLQSQIAQLESSGRNKDQEISDLKTELKLERQNKDISKLIDQIKEPVKSLSDILEGRSHQIGTRQQRSSTLSRFESEYRHNKQKSKSYFNIFLIALLLGFIVSLVYFLFFSNDKTANVKDYSAEIEQLEKTTDEQNDDTGQDVADIGTSDNSDVNGNPVNPFSTPTDADFDINNVKIDISGYNGGNLKKGKTYTVKAKNGSKSGLWNVIGCDVTKKDAESVTIIPQDTSVVINYVVNGKPKTRTLKAE